MPSHGGFMLRKCSCRKYHPDGIAEGMLRYVVFIEKISTSGSKNYRKCLSPVLECCNIAACLIPEGHSIQGKIRPLQASASAPVDLP
jgi:hypothetical protein